MAELDDLPLLYRTPAAWAEAVLARPLALLNDHAHLERKAANNALSLLHQWPDSNPPEDWVAVLTSVAKDEAEHLMIVTRLLERRGGKLTRSHKNPYASALRGQVRSGQGNRELADRLMVSALIEARSCERFHLLAQQTGDAELEKLYRSLWASEHGHYRVFLRLARDVLPPRQVNARWKEMLQAEADIIRQQPPGPGMHSGVAP
ncbi:MAG: tRNA-(ms[2]io[6]A)-hydroxylase [Candidatus Eremiobacterota bacterium]